MSIFCPNSNVYTSPVRWNDGSFRHTRKKRVINGFNNSFTSTSKFNNEKKNVRKFQVEWTNNFSNIISKKSWNETQNLTTTNTSFEAKLDHKDSTIKDHSYKRTRITMKKPIKKKKKKRKVITNNYGNYKKQSQFVKFEVDNYSMVQESLMNDSSEPTSCTFELESMILYNDDNEPFRFLTSPEEIVKSCKKYDPQFEVNFCKIKEDVDYNMIMEVRGKNVKRFYSMIHNIEMAFFVNVKKITKTVSNEMLFFGIMLTNQKLGEIIDESKLTKDEINLKISYSQTTSRSKIINQQIDLVLCKFRFYKYISYFEYNDLEVGNNEKKRWITVYFSCAIDLIEAKKEFEEKHSEYPDVGMFDLS